MHRNVLSTSRAPLSFPSVGPLPPPPHSPSTVPHLPPSPPPRSGVPPSLRPLSPPPRSDVSAVPPHRPVPVCPHRRRAPRLFTALADTSFSNSNDRPLHAVSTRFSVAFGPALHGTRTARPPNKAPTPPSSLRRGFAAPRRNA